MKLLGIDIGGASREQHGLSAYDAFTRPQGFIDGENAPNSMHGGLPVVYACHHYLTQTIGGMRVRALDTSGMEVDIPSWLAMPSPGVTTRELIKELVVSLAHDGNAYLMPVRDGMNVVELHTLSSRKVHITQTSTKAPPRYTYDGHDITDDVLHLRLIPVPGQAKGMCPWDIAHRAIRTGQSAQEFIHRHFSQSAHMQMAIIAKGAKTPEQLRELTASIAARHIGSADKAWRPLALGGDVDVKSMSMTADQAQFVELARMSASQIASHVFRIDPALLDLQQSGTSLTYSNWQDRTAHVYEVTLRPLTLIIEDALTSLLPTGIRIDLDERRFLSGTNRDKHQEAAIMKSTGAFTINEVRAKLGYAAIDGGDELCAPAASAIVVGDAAPPTGANEAQS